MTTLSKTEAEALIDRLASKELTFGCTVQNTGGRYYVLLNNSTAYSQGRLYEHDECSSSIKVIGHPILIGRILRLAAVAWTEEERDSQWLELIKLWHECGIEESLQSILAKIEWEEELVKQTRNREGVVTTEVKLVAKTSPETDLILFIKNLGL